MKVRPDKLQFKRLKKRIFTWGPGKPPRGHPTGH